jgi:hypothetical protein
LLLLLVSLRQRKAEVNRSCCGKILPQPSGIDNFQLRFHLGRMRRCLRYLRNFLLVFVIIPILFGTALGYARGWPEDRRQASWSSAGLLGEAALTEPATVIIISARTGRWKSIFAEHMAIVVKREDASSWTRYEVVGWGNPVRKNAFVADAFWYGNMPQIIYRLEGAAAATLIPKIEASIARYPHQQRGSYVIFPGPNSNSFVAWVVRNTQGFGAELSPVAVGKDWLGEDVYFDLAPSKTGYTLSLFGLLGGTLASEEGVELHLLGSTIGVDFNDLAIKLPSLGKIGMR